MWTKIAKAALVISIIGGVISSFILGAQNHWGFWWMIPLGIGATLLSVSVIGVLIEISEKTSENERTLAIILDRVREIKHTGNTAGSQPSNAGYAPKMSAVDRLASGADNSRASDFWKCKKCGEINGSNSTYCKGCGEYK